MSSFAERFYFLVGYHPDCHVVFRKTAFLIGIFLFGLPVVLGIKGVFYYNDLVLTIECLQATFLFCDVTLRHVLIHFNNGTLKTVLEMLKKMPKPVLEKNKKFLSFGERTGRYYLITGLVIFSVFLVQPVFGKLPVTTYIPEGHFWTLFFVYCFCGLGPFVTVLVTDALFSSLCTKGIVQFRELQNTLKNLEKSDKISKKIQNCVDHHNLLSRYCSLLQKFYHKILLIFFVSSTGAICLQIYVSTNDTIPLGSRMKNWMYGCEQIAQSFLYCVFAELTTEAASYIGDAVYASKWNEIHDEQYKKSLILIMVKAQEKIVFSGGGLVNINFSTFVTILKTAVSFFTYLNSF